MIKFLIVYSCLCELQDTYGSNMVDDRKRYNYMEKVLNEISRNYISLKPEEVNTSKKIITELLQMLTNKMKEKDAQFKAMYRRPFYGGSFYDDLRVKKPNEFDLDLLLCIPILAEPTLTISNIPGFVHLQLKNPGAWLRQPEAQPAYRNFEKLLDDKKYLSTQNVLAWMQSVLDKVLNEFPLGKDRKRIIKVGNNTFEVTCTKSGPALTLKLKRPGDDKNEIDIDLVPCFVFDKAKWPVGGFKSNPVAAKPEFFIVPKAPKSTSSISIPFPRYWRLSFQEQERELIGNKGRLKPTLRLIKKLRDNLGHDVISSYYIKTVFLWLVEQNKSDPTFWNSSLSYLFMTNLRAYRDFIESGKIPYYWNKNNNLIGGVKSATLDNITNKLNNVIKTIESNACEPTTVCKFLLDSEEYKEYMSGNLGGNAKGDESCSIS